jgi:predicted nucleic acid-binding OB-fold protein
MLNEDELVRLNRRIESAIAEGQQALGQKKQLEERLKKDYNIDDFNQIDEVIKTLQEEQQVLQDRIDMGLTRLKEKYGWA